MDELVAKLTELGLNPEQIEKLKTEGVTSASDMSLVSADQIKSMTGCGLITAMKVAAAFAPAPTPVVTASAPTEATTHEGTPSKTEVSSFASSMGMDPNMLQMFLFSGMAGGAGMDIDMSTMMPIPAIVGGYSPKLKNVPYMIMGQIERRLGTPIVVINADGSVNAELTTKYIMSLEENFDPVEDGVYTDEAGALFEVVKVGVDAQGIHDADPLCPTKALQQSGLGTGRIHWGNTLLEVRQVAYYAVQNGEIDPSNENHTTWIRDNLKKDSTRLMFAGRAPRALAAYNEAARSGALPTLRVMLTRGPRTPRVMPNRRTLGDNRPRPTRDRAGVGVGPNGEDL